MNLPVETWMQSGERKITLASTQKIKSVIIDPKNALPDSNRENNVWKE
jgi:hypothetical protein